MIIRKQKKFHNISYILLFICLLLSCNVQKNMQIKRIIRGVIVENLENYTFSDDPNFVYIAGKDTV